MSIVKKQLQLILLPTLLTSNIILSTHNNLLGYAPNQKEIKKMVK